MPAEARTTELLESGWTLTAWLLKSMMDITAIHHFRSYPRIDAHRPTSAILLISKHYFLFKCDESELIPHFHLRVNANLNARSEHLESNNFKHK